MEYGQQIAEKFKPQIDTIYGTLRQRAPFIQDTPGLRGYIGSRLDLGHQPDAIVGDIFQTPGSELTRGAFEQANQQLAPARAASQQQFQAQRGLNAQDFTDLESRIKENATNAEGALKEKFNTLGLLQSGATAAGLGSIQRETTSQLNRGSLQRTLADADAILKETGFNVDLNNKAQEQANKMLASSGAGNYLTPGEKVAQGQFDLSKAKDSSDLLLNPQFMQLYRSNPALAEQLAAQFGIIFQG